MEIWVDELKFKIKSRKKNLVLCVLKVNESVDTDEKLRRAIQSGAVELVGIERWIYRKKDWERRK